MDRPGPGRASGRPDDRPGSIPFLAGAVRGRQRRLVNRADAASIILAAVPGLYGDLSTS